MPEYRVKQGDCIESIAYDHGFFWETLWDHPNNAQLKNRRRDPNLLFRNDVVFIPEKRLKQESGATEQRHRFKHKGVPATLRLRLLDEGEPRANESYVLDVDGQLFSGTTDADGILECFIPPEAKRGRLLMGESRDEYILHLGNVDPIEEISGVQGRLHNLGFECPRDGSVGPETEAAIRAFQRKYDIPETGELDQATRDKLQEEHEW